MTDTASTDTEPAEPVVPAAGSAEPVVAITADDTLLHIASPDDVLDHLGQEAGNPGVAVDSQTWQFYSANGVALVQATDPATGAVTLVADTSAAEPTDLDRQLLLDRIDAFLARVQVELTRDLLLGIDPEHRRVPRISGDLRDVVVGLAALMTVPVSIVQPDSRSWIHNLGHRLRGD
jgi:hypothetical protein